MFNKFAVEKDLMLEFNIAYIANWYFGSDYANDKQCTTESYSDCTQENENRVLCNI